MDTAAMTCMSAHTSDLLPQSPQAQQCNRDIAVQNVTCSVCQDICVQGLYDLHCQLLSREESMLL